MLLPPDQILLVAVVLTLGAVVQGAVGFASGLLGVPLLVLGGLSLPEAATANLVATSIQNVIGAWKLRWELTPRELVCPVVVRWAALPLGTIALAHADQLNSASVRQLVGAVLLVIVIVLWGLRPWPRDQLSTGWGLLAFATSGFLLGFSAIGGAPLVIYVNSLNWSAAKSRGFLFFCSASGAPLMAAMLWHQFGGKVAAAALTSLAALPLIFAALWCGLHLGGKLNKPLFQKITYVLLTLISVISLAAPAWLK
ncbi:TSUP family transporter [Pirellulales bacterium]|nr:TSUP family transporter [Pirellulales bacterium]